MKEKLLGIKPVSEQLSFTLILDCPGFEPVPQDVDIRSYGQEIPTVYGT